MAKTKNNWFQVDKEGLEKLIARKGKSFIVFELIQNAWDQNITYVEISLSPIKNSPKIQIIVKDDDPDGFKDISHAFTLFAESEKKSDPTKRGRFNLGEKLVLACCENASITTTTGTILFSSNGERKKTKFKTKKGSVFTGILKINRKEFEEICESINSLIVPKKIKTIFNGETLEPHSSICSFEASLPTEINDKEGNLKKTVRKTTVELYEPKNGEVAFIYEMGIPIVETGDKYHINIMQKVPLSMDRDNVTPSYLRTIRTLVLNETFNLIKEEDANQTWVKEAVSDKNCSNEAIVKSLDLRFGEKRVIFDPSDPESNKIAVSEGYTVIHGKSLSGQEWANVKKAGAAEPAGKVTPSDKITTSPDGEPPILWEDLSEEQKQVVTFAKNFAKRLMDIDIKVNVNNIPNNAGAWYGGKTLTFNLKTLGNKFFNDFPSNKENVIDLCLHEFGHEYCSDHLSIEYYSALTMLGAKSTILALREPEFFK